MTATLEIADDVLQAAAELARKEGSTTSYVVTELARRGLAMREEAARNGVPLLPSRGETITSQHVAELGRGLGV